MGKYYYLLNHEMKRMIKSFGILSIFITAIMQILFLITMQEKDNRALRFEFLLEKSGIFYVFFIFLLTSFAMIAYLIFLDYHGSKSIYTLLSLPYKRKIILFSKCVTGYIYILMTQVVFLINISFCYHFYLLLVDKKAIVYQAWILAFSRSGLLRLIFPRQIGEFLFMQIVYLFLVCLLIVVLFGIRVKRYRGILYGFALIIYVAFFRIIPFYEMEVSLWQPYLVLLGAMILLIKEGVKIINMENIF